MKDLNGINENDDFQVNPEETNPEATVTEVILEQAGKSREEVTSVGTIERAEEGDDRSFENQFRTANSPVHKAVWTSGHYLDLFAAKTLVLETPLPAVLEQGIAHAIKQRNSGLLYGADEKIRETSLAEMGQFGHWGILVDKQHGGLELSITEVMRYITKMAAEADPSLAGLASIHGCIGAVDPISHFGSQEQKDRFLPALASGQTLSGFALTEPGAGSDLTAVKTNAVLDGDDYVVNGEKLFISNSLHGRTIGLVLRINGKMAVLIVALPQQNSEQFELVDYGLHPLRRIHNHGLIFRNFRVPKANLLSPPYGDGLTIAYHGLNRGRIAVLANASGVMRVLLKSMLPWARYRKTYGAEIGSRELVKRRIARGAALIVATDAYRDFCSGLLDDGYRGELECVIAKILGSEAQLELMMLTLRTHGGRSLLKGNLVGENVFDVFAPLIYEGENEMLAMSFFKSLTKDFAGSFFSPIMQQTSAQGINLKDLQALKPEALAKLLKGTKPVAKSASPLLQWLCTEGLKSIASHITPPSVDTRVHQDAEAIALVLPQLRSHVYFACSQLSRLRGRLAKTMLTHMVKLADKQAIMVDDYANLTGKLISVLVVCFHASSHPDETTVLAADHYCDSIFQTITGKKPSVKFRKNSKKLADLILQGKFNQIENAMDYEILRQYE